MDFSPLYSWEPLHCQSRLPTVPGATWALRVPHAEVARVRPRYGRLLEPEPLCGAASQQPASRQLQDMLAAEGASYQEALRHTRLRAARAMLQEPRNAGKAIPTIAHACGFPEASALSRAFRQHYGMTSGQVRWVHPNHSCQRLNGKR